MSTVALVLYAAGLAVTFGLRTWLHRRRTGSSGFHGITGTPGDIGWWGGVLFIAAIVLGLAAPALALTGTVEPMWSSSGLEIAGLVLAVTGLIAVLLAQSGMGASWRIGVDDTESTELVTGGVFALVRNPIFTAMIAAQAGIALMAPSWVAALGVVALICAIEIQVRALEEPYLLRTHAQRYAQYAARTGRFIPHIGVLKIPHSQGTAGATASL